MGTSGFWKMMNNKPQEAVTKVNEILLDRKKWANREMEEVEDMTIEETIS